MNPYRLPVAIFGFVAIVALMPAWMWFIGEYSEGLPTEVSFLSQFVLPAMVLLFIASWMGGDVS